MQITITIDEYGMIEVYMPLSKEQVLAAVEVAKTKYTHWDHEDGVWWAFQSFPDGGRTRHYDFSLGEFNDRRYGLVVYGDLGHEPGDLDYTKRPEEMGLTDRLEVARLIRGLLGLVVVR